MPKTSRYTVRLTAEQVAWLHELTADERDNAGYDSDQAKWDLLTDVLAQLDRLLDKRPKGEQSLDWLAPATTKQH